MSLYSDLNEVLTPYAQRIKSLRRDVDNIDLDGIYETIGLQICNDWVSGYYNLRDVDGSISIDDVTDGANYVCQYQQCNPGDIFLYTGKGTSVARRYAFLSSDSGENNIITIASNAASEFSDFIVVAPENAQYVIFNSDNRVNHSIVKRRDISFLNTNDDLNDFINEGSYYCNTAAVASTLSNLPEGMSPIGFHLKVKYLKQLNSGNVTVQTIILNSTGKPEVYIRTYLPSADPSWGNWTRLYQDGIDTLLEIKNLSLIADNSDLDNVTAYGSYYCPNAASAKTIKNLPFFVDSGFSLYVVNTGSPDSESYIRQFIFANKGDLSSVYTRVKTASWGDWQLVVTSGSYEQPKVFKEGDILPQRTSDSVKKTIRVGTNNVAHYWVRGRNVADGFDRYLADDPLRIARWRRWLLHANLDILFLQECEDYIDEGYEGHAKTMTAFDHIYKPFFDFDDNVETGASSRIGTNTDITSPSRRKVLNSLGMTYNPANKGVVSVSAISDSSVLYFSWYIVSLERVGRILLVNCHNFAGNGTNYGRTTDRKKYLNDVSTFVLEKMQGADSPDYFIICGDFNVRVSRSDLTTDEITSLDTTWQSNFSIDWQDDYEIIVSFCNRINGIPANGGPIGWFTTVSQEESFPKPYDNIIVSNNVRIEDVDCDPVLVPSSYLHTDHTPVVAEISFLGEVEDPYLSSAEKAELIGLLN